ncbi:MAG TPA: hypothetical protein VGH48_11235 [Caldimonas sp.]
MRSPFVDSASFLSQGLRKDHRRPTVIGIRLLAFALVMAMAASSAVLLAM